MHNNAEIVRRVFNAFNTGDVETLTELFTRTRRGMRRDEAVSLAITWGARRFSAISPAWGKRRQGPSGLNCCI